MAKTDAIAKAEPNAVTKVAPGALAERPARIKDGEQRRGMETMSKADISIPRLGLAQALSPQVTDGDPRRIPGLVAGELFNSLTGQRYGSEVFVQIVRKDKLRAMEFNPIDSGGGVKDPDVPLNDPRCRWSPDGKKPRATIFRDYIAVILPQREIIALSFKSKGLAAAKQLNFLIAMRDANIYEGVYRISSETSLIPKPHKFFVVENAGWVSDDDAREGEKLYNAVKDLDTTHTVDREPGSDDDFNPDELENETPTRGRPSAEM